MTTTVEAHEAPRQWTELLALAKAGTEVILAEAGQPVARLTAMGAAAGTEDSGRVVGLHEGAIWVSDDFDDPLPDDFWCPPDDILLRDQPSGPEPK